MNLMYIPILFLSFIFTFVYKDEILMDIIYILPKKIKTKIVKKELIKKIIKSNLILLSTKKKSDHYKIFYLNNLFKIMDDTTIFRIIKSIKKKELLNDYEILKQIIINDGKFRSYLYSIKILELIEDQEILKQIISKIKSIYEQVEVIKILKNDKDKMSYLIKKEYYYKAHEIIATMNSTENQINSLNLIPIQYHFRIIKSFDDKIKKTFIKNPKYKEYRSDIIASLHNKAEILKYIKKEINPNEKFKMINSLEKKEYKNEEEIEKLIKLIKDFPLNEQLMIISSILRNNKDKKYNYNLLKKYNYKIAKAYYSNIEKEKSLKKINSWIYDIKINPEIKIGVELETSIKNNDTYINLQNMMEKWIIKKELSVTNGVEITSPILHYNKDEMKELFFITNYLKNNNFDTPYSCGGHIHIGFDYINDKETLMILYKLFTTMEPYLFSISNKKNSKLRNSTSYYSKPITNIYQDNIKKIKDCSSLKDLIKILKDMQEDRYYSINIKNALNSEKNTIEFRFPNGEINYNELLLNIILIAKLVEKSNELAHSQDNKLKEKYNSFINNNNETEKLNLFLELLFEDNKIKYKYINRFQNNKEIFESSKKLILNKNIQK